LSHRDFFDGWGGGIVGYNNDRGSIYECVNNGDVFRNYHIGIGIVFMGGIAGYSSGDIGSCENNNTITHTYSPNTHVGGLAGHNNGIIRYSANNGEVNSSGSAGGIAGLNTNFILYSDNYGTVNYTFRGENRWVGGIAGLHDYDAYEICSCNNYGDINYTGSPSNSLVLQPAIGQIVGHRKAHMSGGNLLQGSVNKGALQVVGSHDQVLYVSNGEAGRYY
jgi:hypothetical protein